MTLDGKRILVVEDEYLIAADLRRALREHGAEVVGPTGDLGKGLALAQREQVDAAILDINLEGAMSYPIADELRTSGVPHMFLTGYDEWAVPNGYRDVPTIAKPYRLTTLVEMVEGLCKAPGDR